MLVIPCAVCNVLCTSAEARIADLPRDTVAAVASYSWCLVITSCPELAFCFHVLLLYDFKIS